MQQLKQYKKLLRISCLSCSEKGAVTFQVRFQQLKPHKVFCYEVVKYRQEWVKLCNILQEDIFDYENLFTGLVAKISNPQGDKQKINESLVQCLQRIDVICHRSFIEFFCIQLHYEDFVNGLRQENIKNVQQQKIQQKKEQKNYFEQYKNNFSTDPQSSYEESSNRSSFEVRTKWKENMFDQMTTLAYEVQNCDLQLMPETEILDFTFVQYYENQLLYVLERPRQVAKIKNFFKAVFSQNTNDLGYLSVHRHDKKKYIKNSAIELLAEPLSMEFLVSTKMLLITTTVGVYIYLPKIETKFEQIQIFNYVELAGCIDSAHNSIKGEIYLLCENSGKSYMYVYGLNNEKLMKTQYKYTKPTAICYEQHHNRLFVSDEQGVHIYSVVEFLEIKKLHLVVLGYSLRHLDLNHGYLLGLAEKGFMTVCELKPPQKQQLISVTTNINLPANSLKIVGSSKNKRLIMTYYKKNLVLIDTIQGPIFNMKIYQNSHIKALYSNKDKGQVIVLGSDGHLAIARLNETII